MMKKCWNCGSIIDDKSKYCPKCGKRDYKKLLLSVLKVVGIVLVVYYLLYYILIAVGVLSLVKFIVLL